MPNYIVQLEAIDSDNIKPLKICDANGKVLREFTHESNKYGKRNGNEKHRNNKSRLLANDAEIGTKYDADGNIQYWYNMRCNIRKLMTLDILENRSFAGVLQTKVVCQLLQLNRRLRQSITRSRQRSFPTVE